MGYRVNKNEKLSPEENKKLRDFLNRLWTHLKDISPALEDAYTRLIKSLVPKIKVVDSIIKYRLLNFDENVENHFIKATTKFTEALDKMTTKQNELENRLKDLEEAYSVSICLH